MKAIIAMDRQGLIGINGKNAISNKEDMAFFKSITLEIGTVVVGGSTFDLDLRGRALKGRRTLVVTSRASSRPAVEGVEYFSLPTPEDVAAFAEANKDAICIGGASIYELFEPQLTKIYANVFKEMMWVGDDDVLTHYDLYAVQRRALEMGKDLKLQNRSLSSDGNFHYEVWEVVPNK